MRNTSGLLAKLCLLLLLLSGCSSGVSKQFVWQDDAYNLRWPAPPDTPRIQYLRSINGPVDFRKDASANAGVVRWFFGEGQDDLPLLTPYALAVDDSGVVWVADNGARMLYRIDLADRKISYIDEVGSFRLVSPSGMAVDNARKRLYLADAALAKVFVLDFRGRLVAQLIAGDGFQRPAGVAVDASGLVYVVDVLDGTIALFDADGRFIGRRGSKVNPDGRFNRPLNVAIGPGGEVLVVDTMSFRVEVQSSQGELLRTIGELGDSPGAFARPRGVAVDDAGHVFVSDAAFDNVQVFDLAGQLLMYFGAAGSGPGQFNLPAGLFLDRERRLFVADSYNHRVQVFQLLPEGK